MHQIYLVSDGLWQHASTQEVKTTLLVFLLTIVEEWFLQFLDVCVFGCNFWMHLWQVVRIREWIAECFFGFKPFETFAWTYFWICGFAFCFAWDRLTLYLMVMKVLYICRFKKVSVISAADIITLTFDGWILLNITLIKICSFSVINPWTVSYAFCQGDSSREHLDRVLSQQPKG